MATEKNTTKETELVEVFIPRGQQTDDPNYFVSVNGVNYIMPKGQKSMVPADVAYEIKRSQAAQEMLDRRRDEMIAASQQPV